MAANLSSSRGGALYKAPQQNLYEKTCRFPLTTHLQVPTLFDLVAAPLLPNPVSCIATLAFKNWQPSYNLDFLAAASRRTNEITSGSMEVLVAIDELTGLARARMDGLIARSNAELLAYAEEFKQDEELPTTLPQKIKKPTWRSELTGRSERHRPGYRLLRRQRAWAAAW